MKAWKLDGLGGALRLVDAPMPEVRPGGVLVRMEASALMSYLRDYVEGKLGFYHPPDRPFTPGGNGVGVIEAVGPGVWHLAPGQRVLLSSHLVAGEQVAEPAQILIGVTSFGPATEPLQAAWADGTLAEYALMPASAVTPAEGLDHLASATLATLSRYAVPYGGLVRGRLAAGETVVVTGATGAYGSAAVGLALALGAGRVVAAGRNAAALAALGELYPRVAPVRLSGDAKADGLAMREAAGGSAALAFDMVGQAGDPQATLAALNALGRGGRLVLMGSMTVELPLSYMQIMANDLEVIGQFMYPGDAYRRLVELVRAGLLDLGAIRPLAFPLAELPAAMDTAAAAGSLACVVVTA